MRYHNLIADTKEQIPSEIASILNSESLTQATIRTLKDANDIFQKLSRTNALLECPVEVPVSGKGDADRVPHEGSGGEKYPSEECPRHHRVEVPPILRELSG
jgi:hypothetical protein